MNERQFYQRVSNAVVNYTYQKTNLHPALGHYRIASATSGPRVLTLALVVNPTYSRILLKMGEELSMAAGMNRNQAIRITRGDGGTLSVEIPKPEAMWYNLGIKALPRRHGLKAPVGIDVEHRPALVDFANPLTPHLLTAGTTGCGKTNTARLFVYDLASQNQPEAVQMVLIDTRKRGMAWSTFAQLPHLAHPVVTSDDEALRVLGWAVAEMDRRADERRNRPRVFIAADEAQALLDKKECVQMIGDIAAVGREFGIHLLLATQNPTAEMLGSTNIKRNLTTRLVGKMDSAQSAVIAAGIKESGAELLTGPGDLLLVGPGQMKRITAALLTEADISRLPRCETVPRLDLSEYEDADHVVAQAKRTAEMLPTHIAASLAHQCGINKLAKLLGIGNKRATRVKSFADAVLAALDELGYTIIPHPREVASGGVTGLGTGDGG